jgi:hypothetical protein
LQGGQCSALRRVPTVAWTPPSRVTRNAGSPSWGTTA